MGENIKKMEMTDSFCVYMDVLGFRETIKESFENQKHDELFKRFHRSFKSGLNFANFKGVENEGWNIKAFTDNVVLGVQVKSNPSEPIELSDVIAFGCLFQLHMASDGFFIRGGVARSKLYMDDNLVYGDALIEAVRIENELAVDPRVVISDSAIPKVLNETPYILKDADGQYFLNYLEAIIEDDKKIHWDSFVRHKEHIEKNLEVYSSQQRIWSKYHWLANYHNYFCLQHKTNDGYRPSFQVNESLLKRYPTEFGLR